jgi:cell wall-associated NlpC family hydrolase
MNKFSIFAAFVAIYFGFAGVSAEAVDSSLPAEAHETIGPQLPTAEKLAAEAVTVNPLPVKLQELLIRAISLIGVKYKFGGNSAQSGFDCSGFVTHVFEASLAIKLPRSSYALGRLGTKVEKNDLRPGDLVFYNTLHRAFSHVGIYIGEGRFVHAPSRGKSVEIVDMSDPYWKRRFNGARRLIDDE